MISTASLILSQLAKNPDGMTSKQLSRLVLVAPFTVSRYCEQWVKSGMVCWRWDGDGLIKIWFLCPSE